MTNNAEPSYNKGLKIYGSNGVIQKIINPTPSTMIPGFLLTGGHHVKYNTKKNVNTDKNCTDYINYNNYCKYKKL
tara:strand:+ start:826 stop:1050 length:225 start_codon:yes stop_codon:yes gene_type:complete